jgi:hypothetical protein
MGRVEAVVRRKAQEGLWEWVELAQARKSMTCSVSIREKMHCAETSPVLGCATGVFCPLLW